jgi:ribose 5-phosphate isomerase B
MKIAIGNDHAGTQYKFDILTHLSSKGYDVTNHGTDVNDSVDYPDFVHPVAQDVENNVVHYGILLCGSANGVAMTANKYKGVRAGLCWNKTIVELTRQHNNANILCIPARFVSVDQAIEMVDVFLNTDFEGGRHQNRINKINNIC